MAGTLNLDAAVSAAAAEDNVTSAQATPPPDVGTTQPATPPPTTEAGSGQPAANAGQATAGSAQPTGGTSVPAEQAPASWTLRSQLQELGLDPSQFQDDQAAWQHVRQKLAVRAQEYERQQQILTWQQQQLHQMRQPPQQQQAQPAAETPWWNPPPYEAMWEQPFMQGKDGQPVTPADVDQGIAMKLRSYKDWQREQFGNLLRDPINTLKPGLEQFVQPLVQQAIQQHFGQYQDRQFANQWVQSQEAQLFQKDARGQKLIDGYGQPVLTPTGQKFVSHIQQLDAAGIKNPQLQQQLASALIELDTLRAGQQQAPPGAPPALPGTPQTQETSWQRNARIKQEALQRGAGAGRLPSSGGSPPPSATTSDGGNRGIDVRLSLGQRLNNAFASNGVAIN